MSDDIKKLEEELNLIKEHISALRKKSFETDLVDIYMLNLMPKIKMARATLKDVDIKKANDELKYLKSEVLKIEKKELPIKIIWAVSDANLAIANDDLSLAEKKYEYLTSLYSKEDDSALKKLVYPACMSIFDEILKLRARKR
ncbi:MAG: hypothetical protein ACLFN8_04980 [Candidatus Woesearchaeota archaeon]